MIVRVHEVRLQFSHEARRVAIYAVVLAAVVALLAVLIKPVGRWRLTAARSAT